MMSCRKIVANVDIVATFVNLEASDQAATELPEKEPTQSIIEHQAEKAQALVEESIT